MCAPTKPEVPIVARRLRVTLGEGCPNPLRRAVMEKSSSKSRSTFALSLR